MLYHKIATGYVKSEARQLLKEDLRYHTDFHSKAVKAAAARLAAGRKFERLEMRQTAKTLLEGLNQSPNVLWSKHDPAPKTLSAALMVESIESALLTFNVHNKAPMLCRQRYQLRPKHFTFELGIAPIEIRQHAFERMLQRDEGRQESIRYMLTEIEARMGLLCSMIGPGAHLGERSIAFPMGEGLLLGNVVTELYGAPAHELVEFLDLDQNGIRTQLDANIVRPILLSTEKGGGLGFLARTYISRAEMRPAQKDLHQRLVEIADEFADWLVAIAHLCYFPADVHKLDDGFTETIMDVCDRIQGKVIDVLMQGRYARAMGNEASPTERPVPAAERRLKAINARRQSTVLGELMSAGRPGLMPGL